MNTIFKNKEEFKQKYVESFKSELGKSFERATATERYNILAKLIASEAKAIESDCKKKTHVEGRKKIYYFSMEFLIGKLLKNYLINFGIEDLVRDGLAELGESLDNLCEQERDPGLGNGGLGRLAACFIDSLASLGYSGHGNGIRYNYGLFKQAIKDGQQVELPDNWLENGFPWETRRMENSVVVRS